MRSDELLTDAVGVDYRAERSGIAIGERVVGDHAFDGDAEVDVERDRAFQEPYRGGALLIVVGLGVGQSGVIVDRGVDRVVDDPTTAGLLAAAVRPSAAAVRDAVELLHVDVDQ